MKTLQLYHPAKASLQIILLLVMVLASLGPGGTSVVYAAPLNDNFTNAEVITGLTYIDAENTTTATTQGGPGDSTAADPQPVGDGITTCTGTGVTTRRMNRGNNTVWYKYTTPSVGQTIAVDTIGSAQVGNPNDDLDTYIAVWTGPADGSNLSLVTCNDDNNLDHTSQLSFFGAALTTYYIQVASYNCYYPEIDCGVEGGGNMVFHAYITNTSVYIANSLMGSYYLPSGSRISPIYNGINNGPVQVVSTSGTDIITSERAYRGANYTDWNEMMGFPADQLTNEYWFPLCDGTGTAQTFISIGNASQTPANVTVKIAGQVLSSHTIPVGGRVTPNCAGINNGPVQVYTTNGTNIIVSERAYRGLNFTDWNEMLGFPANQLTTEYWFPLCDGTGTSQTFISIGNASQSTAQVTVKIAGQILGNYTIPVGGRVTPNCAGINNGPVQVYSTNGTDIIVSERAYRGLNYTDWNEMLGLPVDQLTTEYWFPVCDTTGTSQTFLSIGNASQSTAQVSVNIAGQLLGSYTIPVGGRVTPTCPGINNGPVQVYSTNGTNIITSERAYRGPNYTDWNEMLGFPADQLTTEYWFPLSDSTGTAQTFISIAAP